MRSPGQAIETAVRLMEDFAERTGLSARRRPHRYLWTDAFAVCNLLGLGRATGNDRYIDLALRLVDQVHHVLGRCRDDDRRTGWLSGDAAQEGESHPTRGGLRIGKKLPERRPDEPFDERREWDRDGQYFHYLTKWIHALDQTARVTGNRRYHVWARELASAAHRAFVYREPGQPAPRMVWKMSSDLSRVLVPSMGHHDPLDGLVTCTELEVATAHVVNAAREPNLATALSDFTEMCKGRDWRTVDPLGLGGLMTDALRVTELREAGAFADGELLQALLASALDGLRLYEHQGELHQPAHARLPFRELGLAIGLRAIQLLDERQTRRPVASREARVHIDLLAGHVPLAQAIQSFWLDPVSREARTWSEHRDINEFMLATSLVPEGFLVLDISR